MLTVIGSPSSSATGDGDHHVNVTEQRVRTSGAPAFVLACMADQRDMNAGSVLHPLEVGEDRTLILGAVLVTAFALPQDCSRVEFPGEALRYR